MGKGHNNKLKRLRRMAEVWRGYNDWDCRYWRRRRHWLVDPPLSRGEMSLLRIAERMKEVKQAKRQARRRRQPCRQRVKYDRRH